MGRYIEVDTLWKCETCFHHRSGKCSQDVWCEIGKSYRPAYDKFTIIEGIIADAPIANGMAAQDCDTVVGAKWLFNEPDKNGNRKPKCSKCGEYHLGLWSDYAKCNYCPNCGEKISGIEDT